MSSPTGGIRILCFESAIEARVVTEIWRVAELSALETGDSFSNQLLAISRSSAIVLALFLTDLSHRVQPNPLRLLRRVVAKDARAATEAAYEAWSHVGAGFY